MSHVKDCTNRELSGAALDYLRELKSRGNESLDSAIETVSLFHDNLIVLQEKLEDRIALSDYETRHDLDIDYELDYEARLDTR